MSRRVRVSIVSLCTAFIGIWSTGCEADWLGESPRDFMLPQSVSENVTADSSLVDSSLTESVSEVDEEPEQEWFLMEEAGSYAYDCLSEAEQIWYRDMEQILGSFGEGSMLSNLGLEAGLDETNVDRIFQCVQNDHPELFYVEGYSYTKYMLGDEITSIDFFGTYTMDVEKAIERRNEIETAAERVLEGIEEEASDYDKVKYVYETLIRSTDYDMNEPDNQNIYSVFANHRSVCQGYAKATQYLLNRLGVECTLVLGKVDTGEGHAWNLVKIDGDYYYVDTTWGDASYQTEDISADGASGGLDMPEITYDYLNVTTEDLLRTHTVGGVVPMPLCTASAANYYVREGALFTSYDREQMAELFHRTAEEGKEAVTFRCADAVCYEETVAQMIYGQEIFDYLPEGEITVAYVENEKQMSLTFWVTNE